MPLISVIIPVYNEADNIPVLYQDLTDVFKRNDISEYELIFVDDGSGDDTFLTIRNLHRDDHKVYGICLSRNFGHQAAIYAGMESARGDLVITMDGDMQHPPELIPRMIEMHGKGYDIVNTKRIYPPGTGILKKASSGIFYRLLNAISDVRIEASSSDFRLMNRKAADAFLKLSESNRFTRGLVSWMGFSQIFIEYTANPRYEGKSKYTSGKMFRLGLDGITSLTGKPLRISLLFGSLVFLLGIIYAVFAIVRHFTGHTVTGWTSLLVSVLIIGGVQLLSIGLIGLYLSNIFDESKRRPVYFVRDIIP